MWSMTLVYIHDSKTPSPTPYHITTEVVRSVQVRLELVPGVASARWGILGIHGAHTHLCTDNSLGQ